MDAVQPRLSGLVACYLMIFGLLALAVAPAGPASMAASAVRTESTVMLGANQVTGFDSTIAASQTHSNQTAYMSLNASAYIVSAALNLTGTFHTTVVNMSGDSGSSNDGMGYGHGAVGADFNDDGYDDLVIGREGSQNNIIIGGPYGLEGFYGGPQPPTARQFDWQWYTTMSGVSGEGYSLTYGDYNNDGIDDLVSGSGFMNPFWPVTPEVVYIFYGSTSGLPNESSLNLTWNDSVINHFGRGLAGHLDVDGDGFHDLVVSEPNNNSVAGRVTVFWGAQDGLSMANYTRVGSTGSTGFGDTVYGLGDTDGDGAAEFAVGAYRNSSNRGLAVVYEGSVGSHTLTRVWSYAPTAVEGFGYSITGGADMTGDGIPDLFVGAPFRNTNGSVYVFAGTGNGTYSPTPTRYIDPSGGGMENWGISADIVGDFEGDGKLDLAVGGNRWNNWIGRFCLYLDQNISASAATCLNHNSTHAGTGTGEEYAWRIHAVGDLNSDGLDEFTVTAHTGVSGSINPGNLYLFYGVARPFPEDVTLYVGDAPFWSAQGVLRGNVTPTGLGPAIQAYLAAHQADVDASGNIAVPISFNFTGGGQLNVSKIAVRFSVVKPVPGVRVSAPSEGRSLLVEWDLQATDGQQYTVWSNATGSWVAIGNTTIPRTNFRVTNLTDGQRYWFYVTETDPLADLMSAPSAIVSAVPQDVLVPATPGNFSLLPNVAAHSIRLVWSANSDDTVAYNVYRMASGESSFSMRATVPLGTNEFTDTGLSEETSFSYYVRAVDPASLLSPPTATYSGTITDITPPPVPQNVVAVTDVSGIAVDVSWDANAIDTASYEVFFGTMSDPSRMSSFGGTAGTTIEITGLLRDTTYYVAVQAIDRVAHRSAFSSVASVFTVDSLAPAAPVLGSATPSASGNKVLLDWTATDNDIDGFRVYSLEGASWIEILQVPGGQRSAEIAGLTDGQSYEFRVAAFDTGGRLGAASNSLVATPADTARPSAPPSTDVEVVLAGRALRLTWSAPTDSDLQGFHVYYLDPQSGSGFQLAATVGPTVLFWVHGNLSNGVGYSYEVTAYDEVPNESPPGPRVVGVPADTIPPDAPTFDSHPPLTNQVTVTLTGDAEPLGSVQIFLKGALRKTVTADASGQFVADLILGPGENSITARVVDPDPSVATPYKTSQESAVLRVTLDTTRPMVTGHTPAEGATTVDVRAHIAVTFSEAVERSTLRVEVRDPAGNVANGTLVLDGTGRTADFTPAAPFAAGTQYTVTVVGTDVAGNSVDSQEFTFRTAGNAPGGGGPGSPGLEAPAVLAALGLLAVVAGLTRRRRLQ